MSRSMLRHFHVKGADAAHMPRLIRGLTLKIIDPELRREQIIHNFCSVLSSIGEPSPFLVLPFL